MAVIESGLGSDLLTIESATKAAKVSVVDSTGKNVNTVLDEFNLYIPINRFTAVIAGGSYVWAFKNGATKRMKIKLMELLVGFDGTAAATTQRFDLVRFLSGTPTGGTTQTVPNEVSRKSTQGPASTVADVRYNSAAALTITGVVFESGAILTFGVPRSATSQCVQFEFEKEIWLEPGEGLAIRASLATVIGDSIQGSISWSEE